MTREEITQTVTKILNEEFEIPTEKITPEATLFKSLELDSLDSVDLIVSLDKALDIETRDEEAQQIRTVGDVIDYVESSLARK
jgi:acyl carrier protein